VSKQSNGNFYDEDFFHLPPVSTPVVHLSCKYLHGFWSKKFETALMVYSGSWGKLIHEENQKSKILWHCPFKKKLRFLRNKLLETKISTKHNKFLRHIDFPMVEKYNKRSFSLGGWGGGSIFYPANIASRPDLGAICLCSYMVWKFGFSQLGSHNIYVVFYSQYLPEVLYSAVKW
jgi:hypothetical protein